MLYLPQQEGQGLVECRADPTADRDRSDRDCNQKSDQLIEYLQQTMRKAYRCSEPQRFGDVESPRFRRGLFLLRWGAADSTSQLAPGVPV